MIVRRLRGALGVATLWAIAWAASGTAVLIAGMPVSSILRTHPRVVLRLIGMVLGDAISSFGLWGALSGLSFALLLSTIERRQNAGRLRWLRVALWGGAAGLVPPLVAWQFHRPRVLLHFPQALGMTAAIAAVLGATLALATLGLARRNRRGSVQEMASGVEDIGRSESPHSNLSVVATA